MTTDADPGAHLMRVLQAEEKLYLELRALLQREQACITELDAAGLEEAVRAKETLAGEARLLEESRLEVVSALAASFGWRDARPTLSQLCDRLGEAGAGLREAHSRLVALVGAVRELLDVNAAFAGRSLDQVHATLELLGRLVPAQATYGPGGPREASGPGRLVRRSA